MKWNYTTNIQIQKTTLQQTLKSTKIRRITEYIIDWRVVKMSSTQPGRRPASGSCLAPGSFISTNKATPRQSAAVKCSSVWQKCPQFGHTYLCPTFGWSSQHCTGSPCTERTVICFSSKSSLFNFPSRKLLTWLMICTWLPHSLIPLSCSAWLLNILKIIVEIWSSSSKIIRTLSGPQLLCALRMQINCLSAALTAAVSVNWSQDPAWCEIFLNISLNLSNIQSSCQPLREFLNGIYLFHFI